MLARWKISFMKGAQGKTMCNKIFKTVLLFLLLPGIFFWAVSCAVNPVSGKRQLMLLSEKKETELGRKTDSQVISEYGKYEDAELTGYLNDIGRRMGKLSHRAGLTYRIKVLDVPTVNAFAVPGGYVYFTRGILAHLNSEAQLAGVIGHELGHITARHSAQQYTKAQFAQLGLGVGMILSETFRNYSKYAQLGVGMLFLRFSRDNEREADDLGVEYSSRAGYDSREMARFFETLERLHPGSDRSGLPGWFSTHPNPIDRIGEVRVRTAEWQERLGLRNAKIDRKAYLRKIDGLVFGDDPRQGYVENNIFYHPGLLFQFPVPAGWDLKNTRSSVRMASKDKDAAIIFSIAQEGTPEEAARAFADKARAVTVESGRDSVSGLSARYMVSRIRSDQGTIKVMSYFIRKDGKIYVFHGYSPLNKFQDYRSLFRKTMTRFKRPGSSERLRNHPDRIRIRSASRSGPLKAVLSALGAPEKKHSQLAVLNGMDLDEIVPSGTLLKLVEVPSLGPADRPGK